MKRALLILTVAIVGCGSGASRPPTGTVEPPSAVAGETITATPTAAALTHQQLASALDDSCSVEKPKQERLEREFESAMERNALPEAAGVYVTMMGMVKEHTARVEKLRPSPDDRSPLRRYIAAEKRIQGIGARMVRAMKKRDLAQVARLTPLFTRESDRRLTAAIDLDADRCGGD